MSGNPYQSIFDAQRKHFAAALKNSTCEQRVGKLRALRKWVLAHEEDICNALYADRKKPRITTLVTEVKPVVSEIDKVITNLPAWMGPQKKVSTPLYLLGGSSWIIHEPKGVSLVISPWNFPFMLALTPLVSAIAAGNAVVLKPSEFTPHTSALLHKMVDQLFDPEEVVQVEGGVEVSTDLLRLPWNHIFFTGSTEVGKIVMRAAATHLSSITLELGGANPVIVDASADLRDAARKIVWGKHFNDGASCVAPNHVFVHASVQDKLLAALKEMILKMYGADPEKSDALGRIIHLKHFQRLKSYLDLAAKEGAVVNHGGTYNEKELFISPTLLSGVKRDSRLLEEEIFGPLLPVLPYTDLDELLAWQRERATPLALYVFSRKRSVIGKVLAETTAGGSGVNETTLQFAQMELPFGGQNASGIGKAHGHAGFLAFTHERSVFRNPRRINTMRLLHPPYKPWQLWLIKQINRWF